MRRDPKLALLATLASLGALVVTGLVALAWGPAQARDAIALEGIVDLRYGRIEQIAYRVVHFGDPEFYGLLGLALIALALLRGRVRLALALPVVLLGSAVSTQLLKPLTATERIAWWSSDQLPAASWPSGHATATMTLTLCAILAAPARFRPLVALLAAVFAAGVSTSILILHMHFPSDVLGGFFVASTWVLAAVTVLLAAERRWPPRTRSALARERPLVWPVHLAGLGLAAFALAVAASRPDRIGAWAQNNTASAALVATIAALALVLTAGVARTLQR